MEEEYNIIPVDPDTFEYQEYSDQDENIIPTQSLDTAFDTETDNVEFYVYDDNQDLIFPPTDDYPFLGYTLREGDVLLDPSRNLRQEGFYEGDYFAYYNFYRRRLSTSSTTRLFIDQISSDRTELVLRTYQIGDADLVSSTNEFIAYRETQDYFVDFLLNFGLNRQVIANNIQLDDSLPEVPKVLIKLYEPLPQAFQLKDTLWVSEEISTPQAYRVEFPFLEVEDDEDVDSSNRLSGPNYNINVVNQTGIAGERSNYNDLLSTSNTSSLQQLKSLLEEKSININVNYEKREEFIKFSSAEERLKNFYFKASLIESTQNTLSSSIYNISGSTTGSTSFSESKASLESVVDSTIENFDGYEYFLYFNSGSDYSWPKTGSTPPFTLYGTGSTEVLEWYGSKNDDNLYYGGQILSSSLYDEDNPEWLYRTIPEYLVEDPENAQYELFVDMIGQHYDNVWLYTKDVTNRFNADNRLDYGISKDLVADAIKDFGVKLYSNNYDKDDLFQSFLGITSDGSTFPVSNITGSSPLEGYELVKTEISASSAIIPQNDVMKSVYKRIYHNLPYLLKTKGTLQGLRTLVSTFGIPNTILEPREYSAAPRVNQPIVSAAPSAIPFINSTPTFNYALDFTGAQSVDTDWSLNTDWSASFDVPNTMQIRFKAETVQPSMTGPTNNQQILMSLDTGAVVALEYTASSGTSGSYSGSIVDEYHQYGSVVLYPNGTGAESTSVYLPVFNGDWYNVQVSTDLTSSMTLYAGARSSRYQSTNQLGHYSSSIVNTDGLQWRNGTAASFGAPAAGYQAFSGSMQEIRYYSVALSQSSFDNFVLNPSSFTGNGVNTSQDTLAFRASLGGELYTGSLSIHPKVSGSWQE